MAMLTSGGGGGGGDPDDDGGSDPTYTAPDYGSVTRQRDDPTGDDSGGNDITSGVGSGDGSDPDDYTVTGTTNDTSTDPTPNDPETTESDRATITRTGAEQQEQTTQVDTVTVIRGTDVVDAGAHGIAQREHSRTGRQADVGDTAPGIATRENSRSVYAPHTETVDADGVSDDPSFDTNASAGGTIAGGLLDGDPDAGNVPEDEETGANDGSTRWTDHLPGSGGSNGNPQDDITEPDWNGDGSPGGALADNPALNNAENALRNLGPSWLDEATALAIPVLLIGALLWLARPLLEIGANVTEA